MNIQPSIPIQSVVSQLSPKNIVSRFSSLPTKGKIKLVVYTIFLIILVIWGSVIGWQKLENLSAKNQPTFKTSVTYRQLLETDVKNTFTSDKNKAIITLIDSAASQTDITKRYRDYVKAYSLMEKTYKQSPNPKYKEVMVKMQAYAKAFPQYKEKDMVLPQ